MRPRRVPLRKCVACGEMMPKKELIRVVRTPADEVQIDLTGKKAGRGAYLCGKVNCFRLARKSKALDRALNRQVGDQIHDQLEQDFIASEEQFKASKELADEKSE